MKVLMFIGVFLFTNLVLADCPVESYDAVEIENQINATDSCYVASKTARDCSYGSSMDVAFVDAATRICKKDFSDISDMMKKDYESLVSDCWAKYQDKVGSMYVSFAAFCTLEVTEAYSSIYKKIN